MQVDILTAISGVDFEEAWAHRIPIEVEGLSVACLGKDDLIKNKRAAGRPKDLVDVADLEKVNE